MMYVIYSDEHYKHAPRFEIYGGEMVTPFDKPVRNEQILKSLKCRNDVTLVPPSSFSLDTIYRIHDRDYVDFLQSAFHQWHAAGFKGEALPTIMQSRRTSGKCPSFIEGKLGHYAFSTESAIVEGTWDAALASAHIALSATQRVLQGEQSAFALCRPPGHHCTKNQFGGYCYLNNAALAAQYGIDHGSKRVAVLDFDFHHGNGTQDIFYARDDVQYCSIHGGPNHTYPYVTGYADEHGEGVGAGYNLNFPLSPGTTFGTWRLGLQILIDRIKKFQPSLLIVSLGVDACGDDPQSFFDIKQSDFISVGRAVTNITCPTVFIMEGGYNLSGIGNTVNTFLDGYNMKN
jgi:acetoin utilization deacetylase AcuC-like enzyme